MASKRHSEAPIELNKPYEENVVQLKGIIGFGIGLLALIVVTFGLMWALLNVLRDYRLESDGPPRPLVMSEKERLPVEPRLQLAPGFGVDSESGRVNLELTEPQSEYREMRREWSELWEKGRKDEKTGAVSMLPIEAAKEKLLSQNVKAKTGPDAEELLKKSTTIISDSSAGRMQTLRRR